MVTLQGSAQVCIGQSYLISLQQVSYNMQEVSQGSLKLQAHHDKIVNFGSQSTKNQFLEEEVYYLTQLRDHCKTLQITLKPNSNITIHRISKLIQDLRQQLVTEVVATRRETSLAELPLSRIFEERIESQYEEGVVNLDKRLQRIQELVQRQQDRNRISGVVSKSTILNFKSLLTRKIIDEYIKRNHSVKELVKLKLVLASQIKSKTQKYKNNCFINAKNSKISQRVYMFQKHNSKLYRSKTIPPRINHLSQRIQKQAKNEEKDMRGFYRNIYQMQASIFEGELDNIKCQNMKLQKTIDSLKSALSQRQNSKVLKLLSTNKHLETEESKARQLLFYFAHNEKLNEKIKSCSYLWANKVNPNLPPKNMFKSQQECTQEIRKTKYRENHRSKARKLSFSFIQTDERSNNLKDDEVDEKKEDYSLKFKQFKNEIKRQLLKSNQKTNESVQCVDSYS